MSKSVSIRLEDELYEKVSEYADSRNMNFSQALKNMIEDGKIIVLKEGIEILNCLKDIDRKLKCSEITYEEKMRIEEVCNAIWLSLDTLTQKTV
ncbi:hypothetical protein [Qingrenia yutianensis]|uniref:Ribbon-helix-helix protein, CopG family n=1 Tax=Qingrenia yutianensis TaxID=2763676 RepID=A0A926ISY3_9FIRM|nr:hypothetical protein [Qingrenia yutianensis]MBC8596521.1 ribbon-helix-helix protein, CopG family [Qingrenia yutianensis]